MDLITNDDIGITEEWWEAVIKPMTPIDEGRIVCYVLSSWADTMFGEVARGEDADGSIERQAKQVHSIARQIATDLAHMMKAGDGASP